MDSWHILPFRGQKSAWGRSFVCGFLQPCDLSVFSLMNDHWPGKREEGSSGITEAEGSLRAIVELHSAVFVAPHTQIQYWIISLL